MAGKTAATEDVGLGLGEFLGGSAQPAKEAKTSSLPEEKPKAEPVAAESAKAPEAVKEAVPEKTPDEVKETPKEEVKTEPVEAKKPEPQVAEVDVLKKDLERTRKQYEDTRNWATQINQERETIKRQLEIVNKKLDGTYDPEKDAQPAATPEQIAAIADLQGRIKASEASAREKFGNEQVDKWLVDFDAQFKTNPLVQARVLSAPSPIMEGIKVLRETEFVKKWGDDPAKIETAIRESATKDMEAKIEEIVNKRLKERLDQHDKQVTTLAGARSAEAKPGQASGAQPLREIFGR